MTKSQLKISRRRSINKRPPGSHYTIAAHVGGGYAGQWAGLTAALLLAFASALNAADSDHRSDDTVGEPALPAYRVVSFLSIGWSTENPESRNVGWAMERRGWPGFIRLVVRPQLEWGVRRVQIHNPFGTLPGETMQFDQYLHAREAGLEWLYEDFAEAWRPVTRGDYTGGEPVEVIAYFGKLPGDPDFERLLDQQDHAAWLARAFVSIAPALRAGMSIGLDSASTAAGDSPTYRLAELLRSLGVKVYIEPRPRAEHPHWFDYAIITTNHFWRRSDPQRHPADSGRWAARNEQLTGEIIRILHIPEDQKDVPRWLRDEAQKVLADGHTVALPILPLQQAGIPLSDLLAPVTSEKPTAPTPNSSDSNDPTTSTTR